MVENIIFVIRTVKLIKMIPKHIFWPIIYGFSMYVTEVTRIQNVVLRRIGGHGHFRSRDKDGGHTIPSAMADTRYYTQTSRLYLL